MSLWFGASAAAPALATQWGFTAADAGRLTLAVQLGFVAGTLVSAVANVSDVFPPRRVFAASALLAAVANAAFALASAGPAVGIGLRFATGLAAAGGAIALLVGEGPFSTGAAPFDPRQIVADRAGEEVVISCRDERFGSQL